VCGQVNRLTGKLSLAIPPQVSAMRTNESWSVNTQRAMHYPRIRSLAVLTGFGRGLRKRISAPALWPGKDSVLTYKLLFIATSLKLGTQLQLPTNRKSQVSCLVVNPSR